MLCFVEIPVSPIFLFIPTFISAQSLNYSLRFMSTLCIMTQAPFPSPDL